MGKYSVEVFFPLTTEWKDHEEKVDHVAKHYKAKRIASGAGFNERIIEFEVPTKDHAHSFVRDLAHNGLNAQMARLDEYEDIIKED